MRKIESIVKKIKNLNVSGYIEGVNNYESGEMEDIAIERAMICAGCPSNVKEPIADLAIKDYMLEVSERCCDECGCSLPYLIRQKKKSCVLKKW